ncbi:hypothetical protein HAX54_008823, partial [Datura stramonium]|nr:hypothetical protein [Datura stramonium]
MLKIVDLDRGVKLLLTLKVVPGLLSIIVRGMNDNGSPIMAVGFCKNNFDRVGSYTSTSPRSSIPSVTVSSLSSIVTGSSVYQLQ